MDSNSKAPITVLFDTFKDFARMYHRDLALVVLSDRPVAGGRSPRQQIDDDKTYLSRSVYRSKPGALSPEVFADFPESAKTLYSRMRSSQGPARTTDEIVEFFSGKAAQDMARACRAYGLDGTLYSNTVSRLSGLQGIEMQTRAYLLVLLFLETGCLQDVQRAVSDVLAVTKREFNAAPVTQTVQSYEGSGQPKREEEDAPMYLVRVYGSLLSNHPHLLSTGPEGTEIGSLSTAPGSITDVEEGVSRNHLLLLRKEDGQWYARGLHSRNGSVLVSGNDRSETVIEPPVSKEEGFTRTDVLVKPGDKLVLARDTVYMVVQLKD